MQGVLAVDIGTTVAKAAVFDSAGVLLRIVRAPTPLLDAGPGRSELDMNALWAVVAGLVRQAAADSGATIEGLALSGVSCGAWLLARGEPVRPAILWNDGRAAGQIVAWQRQGVLDRVFALSGNVMFPGYTAALLRWLADNEPAALDAASTIVCCKDWLRFKLTGRLATDPSDASYMPYDLEHNRFSRAIWDDCGIGAYFRLVPDILEPGAVAGRLLPEPAQALGLRSGLPVVTGLTDVAAATLGAGAYAAGEACTILGTSCLNTLVVDRAPLAGPAVGIAARGGGGRFLRTMVNTAGTMNLDWFLREIWAPAEGGDLGILESALAAVPVGARGVLFHPYLNTTGVLSPFVHPHARAQFFGLSVEHGRADLGRAILEGVAIAIRDCFAAMPEAPRHIRLVGGGSRNALWCRIIADCLGVPVSVMRTDEPGASGVAMLALVATGLAPDLETLVRSVRADAILEPDRARHDLYSELYALYRSIRARSQDDWTTRAAILGRAVPGSGT